MIFLPLAGLAVGSVLGSFAGVLAYRLPRGEDIVCKPSYCPGCARALTAIDLIPVLSWLYFKGRCRLCHAFIGFEALFFDLGMGLYGAALVTALGPKLSTALWMLAATLAIPFLVIRIRRQPCPSWLPILALAAGISAWMLST